MSPSIAVALPNSCPAARRGGAPGLWCRSRRLAISASRVAASGSASTCAAENARSAGRTARRSNCGRWVEMAVLEGAFGCTSSEPLGSDRARMEWILVHSGRSDDLILPLFLRPSAACVGFIDSSSLLVLRDSGDECCPARELRPRPRAGRRDEASRPDSLRRPSRGSGPLRLWLPTSTCGSQAAGVGSIPMRGE